MRLNVLYRGKRVGQLLEAKDGVYFEFDVLFLQAKIELSPIELPARRGVFGPFPSWQSGLPGVIADSLPDKFGMEVLRRRFEEKQLPRPSPVQILAYQGSRTMGALTYEPCDGETDAMIPVDLRAAAVSARAIVEHEHHGLLDAALLISGATAGGAQPKILVAMSPDGRVIRTGSDVIPAGMEAWMIKLSTGRDQLSNIGCLEHAYAKMAAAAGLDVSPCKLIEDQDGARHFAVKRFDRVADNPNERIHLHTYAGLRHLDFRDANLDYSDLLRTTMALTHDAASVDQQFRRMVFNVLAHNRDDHAKNFSFLMNPDGRWQLAPAYDLIFCENDLAGNWMQIGGKRANITTADFIALSDNFSISRSAATDILADVVAATKRWPEFAAASGVGEGYTAMVERSLTRLSNRLN